MSNVDTSPPTTTPLERLMDTLKDKYVLDRSDSMSGVDISNKIKMDEALHHNRRRLDAQVDAHMRKQHGECYESPEEGEAMAGDHKINSPTAITIIGDSAARELSGTISQLAGEGGTNPNSETATSTGAANGTEKPSLLKKLALPLGLVGASLLGGTVAAVGMSMLNDTPIIPDFQDTRNDYDIEALPFDPNKDWNEQ